MIESGLVKQGLVKVGLVSALQNWAARYFRRNKGTDDYATIPAVTLSGDQRWEFDLWTTQTSSGLFLSGEGGGDRWYIGIEAGKILIGNGTDRVIGTTVINDGVKHSISWELASGVLSVSVDGVIQYSSVLLATLPKPISNVMASEVGDVRTSGIPANLKIYDNGILIRDYPLNEPKGTSVIYDIVGGNSGAIVNGDDEDKGLFTKQANGDWLGPELVPQPIEFSTNWRERGDQAGQGVSMNSYVTVSSAGQGVSIPNNGLGSVLRVNYDISCDDIYWNFNDWAAFDYGELVTVVSSDQSGIFDYEPQQSEIYLRHDTAAASTVTLNSLSIKEVLKSA